MTTDGKTDVLQVSKNSNLVKTFRKTLPMSYLEEVLNTMETVEIEEINRKSSEVVASVEKCKNKIMTFMEKVYVTFSDRPKRNKQIALEIDKLEDDITRLLNNSAEIAKKDLVDTKQEIEEKQAILRKTQISICLVGTLFKIHELLMDISNLRETNLYQACLEKILAAEEVIHNLNFQENLPCLEELVSQVYHEKTLLLCKLSEIFESYVICASDNNTNILKIKNLDEEFSNVLNTLYINNPSIDVLYTVTRFLWDRVFVPIVDCTTQVKTYSEETFECLNITIIDVNKRSPYKTVFERLTTTLQFLAEWFDTTRLEGSKLNTLEYIGNDIRDNLSELIIKHCLKDTVPSTEEELKEYTEVVDTTAKLEELLIKLDIFDNETPSILSYTKNINVLFIDKKCTDYIDQAKGIMRKDLHNVAEVGTFDGRSFAGYTEFPQCSISKNVVELITLIEKILDKAITESDFNAGRLSNTALFIYEKYPIIVPQHHKKLLETIPQQVALFYNNCMYLAHNLTKWIETLMKLQGRISVTFSDFMETRQNLTETAEDMFKSFVDSQVKQIEEIMKEAKLDGQTLESIDPATEKSFRQCLRQEELLKTVWQKVLPYSIYNKTLGTILNALCNFMIDSLTKLEDISSEAAEQLVDLLKIVQTRGPKLFTDPQEVSLFVGSWHKLNELVFILNASLVDINDRWADGKGPLALYFKAGELKQLVRALFQNTERRAALLAKIQG